MNPVLKRPEIWVLSTLSIVGAVFVIVSQKGLEEELENPVPPSRLKPSSSAGLPYQVRFDLDTVVQREVSGKVEFEITGTVRNNGDTEIDPFESARLKVGAETAMPLFLASNVKGSIPAGGQRKVLLPFVVDGEPEGTIELQIDGWKGQVK